MSVEKDLPVLPEAMKYWEPVTTPGDALTRDKLCKMIEEAAAKRDTGFSGVAYKPEELFKPPKDRETFKAERRLIQAMFSPEISDSLTMRKLDVECLCVGAVFALLADEYKYARIVLDIGPIGVREFAVTYALFKINNHVDKALEVTLDLGGVTIPFKYGSPVLIVVRK